MTEQTVSIIVRCRGRLAQLKESLKFLFIQDHHFTEIIVVNYDCPDDLHHWLAINTSRYILNRKLIEVIVKDKQYFNHSHSRNVGLHAAQGDWVLFISAEDRPHYQLVSHLLKRIGDMDKIYAIPSIRWNLVLRKMLFARRKDLLDIGGFNEDLIGYGYEHEDVCERLLLHGLEQFRFSVEFTGMPIPHSDDIRRVHLPLVDSQHNWKELSRANNLKTSREYVNKNGIVVNKDREFGVGGTIFESSKQSAQRWIHEPDNPEKRTRLKSENTYGFKFDKSGKLQNEDELIKSGCRKDIIERAKQYMLKKKEEKSLGLASYVSTKMGKLVSDEIIAARKTVCVACEEIDENKERLYRNIGDKTYCGRPRLEQPYRDEFKSGCGCELNDKWRYELAKCPRDKWPGEQK
jgi:glycosyltransferase involved in cell wall biosynthesis